LAGAAAPGLTAVALTVLAAVARAYADPRGGMAGEIARGLGERRALAHLMLACGLGFLASLPLAVRTATRLDLADPLAAAVAAHLFGYLFVLPLLLYGVAALAHIAARALGGRGGFLAARAAMFRAAALGAPLAVALAFGRATAGAALGPAALPWFDVLGYVVAAFWLWLIAASFAEAEGFGARRRAAAGG
jgi:hypothetical protein